MAINSSNENTGCWASATQKFGEGKKRCGKMAKSAGKMVASSSHQVPNFMHKVKGMQKRVGKRLDGRVIGRMTEATSLAIAYPLNSLKKCWKGDGSRPVEASDLRAGTARFMHLGMATALITVGTVLTPVTFVGGLPFLDRGAHSLRTAFSDKVIVLLRSRFGQASEFKKDRYSDVEDALKEELREPEIHKRSPANASTLLKLAVKSQHSGVITGAINTLVASGNEGELHKTFQKVVSDLAGRLTTQTDYKIIKNASRLNALLDALNALDDERSNTWYQWALSAIETAMTPEEITRINALELNQDENGSEADSEADSEALDYQPLLTLLDRLDSTELSENNSETSPKIEEVIEKPPTAE